MPGIVVLIVSGWAAMYIWRSMAGHYSLATNAFDLSVFDYALWSLLRGDAGAVPFIGHSIFAHHFMPILVALAPIYWAFQSPAFLLILQILIVAAAGLAFFRVQQMMGVDRRLSLLLLLVFLFSRRTHSATAGLFYPESLQTLLTFCLVLAFRGRPARFWLVAVLLLATKEDAPVYAAAFGALQWMLGVERRRAAMLTIVSMIWFAVAVFVAIPLARRADGLPIVNPLIETRFGTSEGSLEAGVLVDRLMSRSTLSTIANLALMTGGLPALAPLALAPAVPGMAINMTAPPHSMQAGLSHHYAWPVLPWLFIATAAGAHKLHRWRPAVAFVWVGILSGATVVDNPSVQRVWRTRLDPEAMIVRQQLRLVPDGGVVLAQPNLILHLPHRREIYTLGSKHVPATPPDVVLITPVGSLWPLTPAELEQEISRYAADPRYTAATSGPLWMFVKR
jgi:uncharacterized membrane protein